MVGDGRSSALFQCRILVSLCLDSPVAGPLPQKVANPQKLYGTVLVNRSSS
jgi:hypothetical protein